MSDVRHRSQKGGSAGSLRKSPSHSKSRVGGVASLIGIGLFIIVVVAVTASYTFFSNFDPSGLHQRKGIRTNIVQQQEEADETVVDRKLYEELKAQNRDLQEQLRKSKEMVDNHNAEGSKKERSKLQRTVERLRNYKFRMHDAIKSISKRQLLAKYGEGPHFVEIEVAYDPNSNIYSLGKPTEKLIIELAPVDDMPATVFFFLEQVNATLFDGCSFHRNAGHVVQGGPAPNFLTIRQGEPLMKKFNKAGLVSVPFQEYSPKFPHKKYTLGYAGRPGGPDFYVSTMDNTRNHGPGGQASYEDASEADPCFAKVVSGYEHVVDRMHKSSVQPGDYKRMEHYVAIKSMRLLSRKEASDVEESLT